MEINELKQFINKAKENTYASGKKSEKREDGADCYKFTHSDFNGFEYEDVYYGNRKFSGHFPINQTPQFNVCCKFRIFLNLFVTSIVNIIIG